MIRQSVKQINCNLPYTQPKIIGYMHSIPITKITNTKLIDRHCIQFCRLGYEYLLFLHAMDVDQILTYHIIPYLIVKFSLSIYIVRFPSSLANNSATSYTKVEMASGHKERTWDPTLYFHLLNENINRIKLTCTYI